MLNWNQGPWESAFWGDYPKYDFDLWKVAKTSEWQGDFLSTTENESPMKIGEIVATQGSTVKYNVLNIISDISTLIYSISVLISDMATLKYDMRMLVSGLSTIDYDLRNIISDLSTFVYSNGGWVRNDRTLLYQIRSLASGVSTAKWDMRQLASDLSTVKYDLRNLISDIVTCKYDGTQLATGNPSIKYSIANILSRARTFPYYILLTGETVEKGFGYDVLLIAGDEIISLYDTVQHATGLFIGPYDIAIPTKMISAVTEMSAPRTLMVLLSPMSSVTLGLPKGHTWPDMIEARMN